MVDISVVAGDITERPCDVVVLKHADGFYGADKAVSNKIQFNGGVPEGGSAFLSGRGIEAWKVLYVGVGPLYEFRYSKIRAFAKKSLEILSQGSGKTEIVCTPIHGPGYGLDVRESFFSLIAGFMDAIKAGVYPKDLRQIEIVELDLRSARRLQKFLSDFWSSVPGADPGPKRQGTNYEAPTKGVIANKLSSFGSESEDKTKLFVAMPFAETHSDVWDIAIQEACLAAEIVCERVDKQAYTGDILTQIKNRLRKGNGVIALLNDANPNVFLEIGFAWGLEKPVIMLIKKGADLPFDVRGQKCIEYESIARLRSMLTSELIELKSQGVFYT